MVNFYFSHQQREEKQTAEMTKFYTAANSASQQQEQQWWITMRQSREITLRQNHATLVDPHNQDMHEVC